MAVGLIAYTMGVFGLGVVSGMLLCWPKITRARQIINKFKSRLDEIGRP